MMGNNFGTICFGHPVKQMFVRCLLSIFHPPVNDGTYDTHLLSRVVVGGFFISFHGQMYGLDCNKSVFIHNVFDVDYLHCFCPLMALCFVFQMIFAVVLHMSISVIISLFCLIYGALFDFTVDKIIGVIL